MQRIPHVARLPKLWLMQRPTIRAGVLALALAIVISVVSFVAYPAFLAAADHVHVVVTQGHTPTTQRVIFDQKFTTVAPQIYAQLVSGNRIPPNAIVYCPSSSSKLPYNTYTLTFFHAGIQTGVATSDAIGCAGFALTYPVGATAYFSWYDTQKGSSFWVRLHDLTHAPEPINCDCAV